MSSWYWVIVVSLVLCQRQRINADPSVASGLGASRPVWYDPVSTSLVYQRSVNRGSGSSHGESRAFPSPVFYVSTSLTTTSTTTTTPSPVTTTTSPSEEASTKSAKKYDIFKFFEKLKRVNEKYANRNRPIGTQKQLNGDAEDDDDSSSTHDSSTADETSLAELGNEQRTAESDENRSGEMPINEGMLIVTERTCNIKFESPDTDEFPITFFFFWTEH